MALLNKEAGYNVEDVSPLIFLQPRLHQLNVNGVVDHDARVRITGMLKRVTSGQTTL